MPVDEPINILEADQMEIDNHIAQPDVDDVPCPVEEVNIQPARMRRIRHPKVIITDEATSLRNMELGKWNTEYAANMVEARNQRDQNKIPAMSKKNAAFWVFGQGIGSVGVGLGVHSEPHPLKAFSGKELLDAVCSTERHKRKRLNESENPDERHVRTREDELSRENIDRLNMDVEIGRDAPSSLLDDRSSQMPWNITASIQSSLRARRYGSVSEMSSRKGRRSRLPSASPLAGRKYRDIEDFNLDFGDDLDLTRYLEGELATDRGNISSISPGVRSALENAKATLDKESLNFFEFMKSKMGMKNGDALRSNLASPVVARLETITFASLMPPVATTRAVATQALVNLLTLATKGVIRVHQDRDGGGEWGSEDMFGEIHLKFTGI